jgi:hypothetical protein
LDLLPSASDLILHINIDSSPDGMINGNTIDLAVTNFNHEKFALDLLPRLTFQSVVSNTLSEEDRFTISSDGPDVTIMTNGDVAHLLFTDGGPAGSVSGSSGDT